MPDEAKEPGGCSTKTTPLRLLSGRDQPCAEELLLSCDFSATAPNQKWLTDISEFQLPVGKVSRSHLVRIETRAGHGAGRPMKKVIDELADKWVFAAHWTGLK